MRIMGEAVTSLDVETAKSDTAPLLTVLIPCFNEAKILKQTVEQLEAYFSNNQWQCGLQGGWEVLFVDDGSTDNSREILTDLAREHSQVRFISYRMNAGQGHALQKGFQGARGDWIFCVDADLDYGPDHIESFLSEAQRRGADIVVGSVYMQGGSTQGVPPSRLWMSKAMNWYFKKVLRLGFSTYTSILRLYKREAIQSLLLTTPDKDVLPEILIKASTLNVPTIEVPAHLHWKDQNLQVGRAGASVFGTASKAVQHFIWGALENPFLFFSLPGITLGLGTLWFGIALTTLFAKAYSRTDMVGLQAITVSAREVVMHNPQTIVIFAVLLQASLVLSAVGIIVLQNKIKKEQDYIYFSKLLKKVHDSLES